MKTNLVIYLECKLYMLFYVIVLVNHDYTDSHQTTTDSISMIIHQALCGLENRWVYHYCTPVLATYMLPPELDKEFFFKNAAFEHHHALSSSASAASVSTISLNTAWSADLPSAIFKDSVSLVAPAGHLAVPVCAVTAPFKISLLAIVWP